MTKRKPIKKVKEKKKLELKPYIDATIVIVAMIWAYQSHWLTDDIFVTLRYINQWFGGNGLVFNAGEYVEGYTHPLWLLLIAGFNVTGIRLELIPQLLGIASFGGIVFLLTRSGWLAAVLFTLSLEARIWATGGLETMFFTLLVFATVWGILQKKYNWVGWLMLAMMLTRLDSVVIIGICILFVFIEDRKNIIKVILPLFLYLPFLLWRYLYYGDLLPNTYYTKSGGGSYYEQGFYYVWLYASIYISSFLILIGLKFIKRKEIILPLSIIISYIVFFVARVGGDFMYARFLIPLIPLVYFIIEFSLKQFNKPKLLFGVLLLVPVEMSLRNDMFYNVKEEHKPAFELKGITDEQWYWSHKVSGDNNLIDNDKVTGEMVQQLLARDSFVVLLRSQCAFGYYLGNNITCIDNSGLTDSYIARLPIKERSRVGHEKTATLEYMKQRGVHFIFNRSIYDKNNKQVVFRLYGIQIRAEIIVYDDIVKNLLRSLDKTQYVLYQNAL